ncbi:MAG: hypothetical protein GY868_10020, partial [Deltaproteobacteria bacterium]|nr:hypothetical protein [Deltaproteobacteria bacterium]
MNPQCAPFLAQLQGLFDEERVLSREVQDCVDTMLLNPTAEAFEAYMRDSDDSECDSIRELFFFPDETQQYALESFIEAAEFSPEDEKKLMQRLGEMRIEPAFCFPDGRGTVSLMMVPEAAAAFVQR